ncbi:MAG TPA: hypothetical protein VFB99_22775, partial [Vicinamibacterales bacterium]|nr:hypothetical protein [Vicinamibacterales bacterium]
AARVLLGAVLDEAAEPQAPMSPRARRPPTTPVTPPLLLGTISFESLREEAPVYLEASGHVACGDAFRWKGPTYYARQYAFCVEFLTLKGLPLDVSSFREKGLMDVIRSMADGQTITREELLEVAHQNNHIAGIREAILGDTRTALYRKAHPRQRRAKLPKGACVPKPPKRRRKL